MTAIWTRINTVLLLLVLMALLTLIAMFATGVRGGPLDPPGAPGSTDSVRLPGTPISSIPYTINTSGHYYLTRNLGSPGAGNNGIRISAEDVTLDLMGFTLDGAGLFASGNGILVQPPVPTDPIRHITIQNGIVRNWGQCGIEAPTAIFSRFEDLTLADNSTSSCAGLHAGPGNFVERVMAHNNYRGIWLVPYSIFGSGYVRNSSASHNSSHGLHLSASQVIVEGNTFNNNGQSTGGVGIFVEGNDNVIRENETDWNYFGIYVAEGDNDNEFTRNHSENNTNKDCHDVTLVSAPNPTPNDWGYPFPYISPFHADVIYYSQVFGNVCVTVGP